jgi:outer membrane biogenesis lipoprotein LolB
MKSICIMTLALALMTLTACSSSQDKAYKAQEKVHKERLELVDKYQKCLEKTGEDKDKKEACEHYLKAAEALK